jgi:hypothetical protein
MRERGLRQTLPRSKGDTGKSVTVPIPYGATELCPVRALRRWQDAAGIAEGAVFRRIWVPALGCSGEAHPCPGSAATPSMRAVSPASSRRGPKPPGSSAAPWVVTV